MEAIWNREIILNKAIRRVMAVCVFVVLTALGGFVRIPLPFSPVPITLQTFFVLLSGVMLGGWLGVSSQLSYILLGIMGLPIFSGANSGLFYLFGPTAGYLFGFVLASFFLGRLIKYCPDRFLMIFLLMCLADLLILSLGIVWLKLLFGYHIDTLLFIGLIPFIPGDLLKAFLASVIYAKLKTRLKEIL